MTLNEVQIDCTGYEFALGSVVGYRRFSLDRHRRLGGMSYSHVWRPGENVAECQAREHKPTAEGGCTPDPNRVPNPSGYFTLMMSFACVCPRLGGPALHDDAKCPCGFYAFLDPHDGRYGDYMGSTVDGVIEGYGRTVVGIKGFRSEKAKIVALYVPRGKKAYRAESKALRQRLAQLYDLPIFKDRDEMLAAHPLSETFAATPDVDADFWDRP